MKSRNSLLFILLVVNLFITALFPALKHLGSYTSILNPSSVVIYDDLALSATSGGVALFDLHGHTFDTINNDDGLELSNIRSIGVDSNNNLILGGQMPGTVQVYSFDRGLVGYLDDLISDEFYIINECDGNIFSASYDSEQGFSLYEFRYNNNQIYYYDSYDFFDGKIIDIDCLDSHVYVSTGTTLYSAKVNDAYLSQPSSWDSLYASDILGMVSGLETYYIVEKSKVNIVDGGLATSSFDIEIDTLIEAKIYNDTLFILDTDKILGFKDNALIFSDDLEVASSYTGFDLFNDKIYASVENYGIAVIDLDSSSKEIYSPNTLLKNAYTAIEVTDQRDLIGVSNDGGFIMSRFKSLKNFLSVDNPSLPLADSHTNSFWSKVMTYSPGRDMPWSVVSQGKDFYFTNRSVYPRNQNTKGAIINMSTNLESITCWDTTNAVIDGLNGIYNPAWSDGLMVINQLKFDGSGNLWALNPYSEKYGYVAAIMDINKDWHHVYSNPALPSIPLELDFDSYGNVWIAFESQTGMESTEVYSVGGIRVLDYNNTIHDHEDDSWYSIINSSDLPGGSGESVWSLAIDKMGILWVLTSYGVQGYFSEQTSSGFNLEPVYPYPFYSNVPFFKGDKIRVDEQNNKWITTRHSGVFVITEDLSPWPTAEGINISNSRILSNSVYDIAFDDKFGILYLSTMGGISIFDIPFSDSSNSESILVSPNPYSISSGSGISIAGSGSRGVVTVSDLQGNVVKRFKLENNENKVVGWDGTDSDGNLLRSGVYIVSSYSKEAGSRFGKIAIVK